MADRDGTRLLGETNLNRRGLLKCMGWAGTGVVWSLSGGVPRTLGLIGSAAAAEAKQGDLTFVQISDNHIGFHLPPNPNPTATLGEAIAKIKAMPSPAGLPGPYRGHQPPVEGRAVGHRRSGNQGGEQAGVLYPGRARRG